MIGYLTEPSPYEINAIKEIHAWKNPSLNWFEKIMEIANAPLGKIADLAKNIPGVDFVIEKAIGGVISLLNDLAHSCVRPTAIFEEFQRDGYKHVKEHKDILSLDLADVDRVIGYLAAKYKSLSAVEGVAAGYFGLPGIAPDIISLITLNQRAIGEYATYFGFDICSQEERLFALNILGLASSPNDAAKQVAMAQLVLIAKDVAAKKTWQQLEEHAFVKIIKIIAESIGKRLTKAKLAQILPEFGAIVGGGFNSYYTSKVCDAAFFLYRERFLAEKYGPDIIEKTVKPAKNFKPNYEDE